jgi:hypothetical protein
LAALPEVQAMIAEAERRGWDDALREAARMATNLLDANQEAAAVEIAILALIKEAPE